MIELLHPLLFLVLVVPLLAWLSSVFLPPTTSRWCVGGLLGTWLLGGVWFLLDSFGADDPREIFASVLWPVFQTPALYVDLGLRGDSTSLVTSVLLGCVVSVAVLLVSSARPHFRQRIMGAWLVAVVLLWSRNALLAAAALAVWQISVSGTGTRDAASRLLRLASAGLVLAGVTLLALYNHQAPDRWGLGSADWKTLDLFWADAASPGASINNVHLLVGMFTLAFLAAVAGSGLGGRRTDAKKSESLVSWLLSVGVPGIFVLRLGFLWERCSMLAFWTFLALMGGASMWLFWWLWRKESTKEIAGGDSPSRDWELIARRQGVTIVTSSLAVWGWIVWAWLN